MRSLVMIARSRPRDTSRRSVFMFTGITSWTIGSTSARAEFPKDRPYPVPHVLATLYKVLGIDPSVTFPNTSGRPMYILDDREVVPELL